MRFKLAQARAWDARCRGRALNSVLERREQRVCHCDPVKKWFSSPTSHCGNVSNWQKIVYRFESQLRNASEIEKNRCSCPLSSELARLLIRVSCECKAHQIKNRVSNFKRMQGYKDWCVGNLRLMLRCMTEWWLVVEENISCDPCAQ